MLLLGFGMPFKRHCRRWVVDRQVDAAHMFSLDDLIQSLRKARVQVVDWNRQARGIEIIRGVGANITWIKAGLHANSCVRRDLIGFQRFRWIGCRRSSWRFTLQYKTAVA